MTFIELMGAEFNFTDFHITYEEDSEGNCVPIITLELMSDSSNDSCEASEVTNEPPPPTVSTECMPQTGIHFLTDEAQVESKSDSVDNRDKEDSSKEASKGKPENLEYRTRSDGSVVCKLCGEVLQSRTQWYRHKYKMHVPPALNPTPLYQCEQCLVFFKSRKGYIGHVSSRHSELLSETSTQNETTSKEQPLQQQHQQQQQQQLQQHNVQHLQQLQLPLEVKDDDPEVVISKSVIPASLPPLPKLTPAKPPEPKKSSRSKNSEWEEKRIREEKMVSDIIDRVRRECEAQGSGGPARKGYNRRTTVMHT